MSFNKKKLKPKKQVAIVVPMSTRQEITPDEKISLNHLYAFLGDYDKFMIVPESMNFNFEGFRILPFEDQFFGSVLAHVKLILSPKLYETFSDYEYILMYHLDSLVFSDQLSYWCKAGYDYIGAPWIKHEDAPYAGNKTYEGKVGNGGFTLKKVQSCLNVLYSKQLTIPPSEYWQKNYASKPAFLQFLNMYKILFKRFGFRNTVKWENRRLGNKVGTAVEYFWAHRANHYYPQFRIASVETAIQFAFECVPRYCFEMNGKKLPFGCHAWSRYDPEFWEPYLLK